MKKFISIITMFVLSVTLLSVPVQAEINEAELMEALELSNLTPAKTTLYEYNVIDRAKNSMGEDYEIMLLSSDIYEDVYIYTFIPKNNELLYIAKDAYRGDIKSIQFWNEFTDMLRETSVYMQEHASTLTGNKYAVMILNPENYEHFIWMGFDGEVVYDSVNGIDDADVLFN